MAFLLGQSLFSPLPVSSMLFSIFWLYLTAVAECIVIINETALLLVFEAAQIFESRGSRWSFDTRHGPQNIHVMLQQNYFSDFEKPRRIPNVSELWGRQVHVRCVCVCVRHYDEAARVPCV